MIQRVFERARLARTLDRVVVATDDSRVADAVRAFGGDVILTRSSHVTGTDRIAEAAAQIDAGVIVNVQGDEPLLDPETIDAAVEALRSTGDADLATPATALTDPADMLNPGVVKVIVDAGGFAVCFSRAPIPFFRVCPPDLGASARETVAHGLARKHIGIYAYRKEALARFAALPATPWENAEGLEQLRALHHGMRIRVVDVPRGGGPAVDTFDDVERVRMLVASSEKMIGRSELCPPSTSS